MTPDQNKAIALIIPLIVKNNAGKVALALRDAGYSKDFIPVGDLEARMFQLYTANPDMFFEVMKDIPWNNGHAETNKPEIKDELIKLVAANSSSDISKDNWWPELLSQLSRSNESKEQPSAYGQNISWSCYGIAILILLAGIGIAVALYFLLKS